MIKLSKNSIWSNKWKTKTSWLFSTCKNLASIRTVEKVSFQRLGTAIILSCWWTQVFHISICIGKIWKHLSMRQQWRLSSLCIISSSKVEKKEEIKSWFTVTLVKGELLSLLAPTFSSQVCATTPPMPSKSVVKVAQNCLPTFTTSITWSNSKST